MLSDRPEICSREIISTDIPDIADLLARGFPKRNRQFWVGGEPCQAPTTARLSEVWTRYGKQWRAGGSNLDDIFSDPSGEAAERDVRLVTTGN